MADTATVKLIAKFQNRMGAGLKSLGADVTKLGLAFAAVAAAVLLATKKMADSGAEIFDTSAATNVAVEDIQALGYVFEQTGGSASSMSGALRGVNTFMRMASRGGVEQVEVLERLGLSYQDIATLSPSEAFLLMTDSLGGMTNAMEQNMNAAVIFGGRYSQQVIGALNQTDGSMRDLMQTFQESGRALSTEQIAALKKYSDAMTDLDFQVKKMMADALVPLLPMLKEAQQDFLAAAEDALPKLVEALADAVPIILDMVSGIADLSSAFADLIQASRESGDGAGNAADAYGNLADTLQTAVERGFITGAEAAETLRLALDEATGDAYTLSDALIYGPIQAISSLGEQSVFTADELTTLLGRMNDLRAASQQVTAFNPFEGLGAKAQEFLQGVAEWTEELTETGGGDILGFSKSAEKIVEIMDKFTEYQEAKMAALREESDLRDRIHDKELSGIDEAAAAQNAAAQKRFESLQSEEAKRIAMMTRARQMSQQWGTSLVQAALRGEDGMKAWADAVIAEMVRVASTKVFGLIFDFIISFATGGAGGIAGKLAGAAGGGKGFSGGGTIPGGAGGLVIPGAGNSDTQLFKGTPREVLYTERQAQDVDRIRQGGTGTGGTVIENFYFSPLYSDGSPAQIARALKIRNRLNEMS